MSNSPDPTWHRQQIKAYLTELPRYETYAAALKRVFTRACRRSDLLASVEGRAKTVSSFAEKCVRKLRPDPVNQFTDLCGARIVVQTLEQVRAVQSFIEANFEIVERDDKSSLLGEDKFGYRDMHFKVRLEPDRAEAIGFSPDEIDAIGRRIAEVQVRSLVQHAWADIVHDRVYKAALKLSPEAKRTTALLAAIMEDGDRSFEQLAAELDGMAANYTAYADLEKIDAEIAVQELLLANEEDKGTRPAIALRLSRLYAPCGRHDEIVDLLETEGPGAGDGLLKHEILLELGSARCRKNRHHGKSTSEYLAGKSNLAEVIAHCEKNPLDVIPNERKRTSLNARACSRLAWSLEVDLPRTAPQALELYRRAFDLEPSNPYHLANQLGFEVFCQGGKVDLLLGMRPTIRRALSICRDHALAGTELPYAHFTAGRLSLLLGEDEARAALGWYARGLRHFYGGRCCVSDSALLDEVEWIERLSFGAHRQPPEFGWILRLVDLAKGFHAIPSSTGADAESEKSTDAEPKKTADAAPEESADPSRYMIIAGGAASMPPELLKQIKPLLLKALENFHGKVISGGTRSGIPGCVGEIAEELRNEKNKHFEAIGYVPTHFPGDAPPDSDRYDNLITVGDHFSPSQILQMWEDLLDRGVPARHVSLLGFGGGEGNSMTAVEFRVAFALGATVAAVQETGGAAAEILADPLWATTPSILPVPFDQASIQAFFVSPGKDPDNLEDMAEAFHKNYLKQKLRSLPQPDRPWKELDETYKAASREQARHAIEILRACGFGVREAKGKPKVFKNFTDDEIECMSELEHGRWNVERLRNGWRPGPNRDNDARIHDCIVPWEILPESIREYDRFGVRAFPMILAKAGLEVFRK